MGIFGLILAPNFFAENFKADLVGTNPQISSVIPLAGTAGDLVRINGRNFGLKTTQNVVGLGDFAAPIKNSGFNENGSQTMLVVVPDLPQSGDYPVTLTTSYGTAIASASFRFTKSTSEQQIPILESFEPKSGKVGTPVYLYGQNFGLKPTENLIKFNGVPVQNVEAVFQEGKYVLRTVVPEGATTGHITLMVNNLTADSRFDFTVPLSPEKDDPLLAKILTELEEGSPGGAEGDSGEDTKMEGVPGGELPSSSEVHSAGEGQPEILLRGSLAEDGAIQLSWEVSPGVPENFQLFYSTHSGEYVHGFWVGAKKEFRLGENLAAQQAYFLQVRALSRNGQVVATSNEVVVYFSGWLQSNFAAAPVEASAEGVVTYSPRSTEAFSSQENKAAAPFLRAEVRPQVPDTGPGVLFGLAGVGSVLLSFYYWRRRPEPPSRQGEPG